MVDVVLVNPKYDGNIGSVARVIKNFGFYTLKLVSPYELKRDAYAMASHASDVLDACITYESLEEAIRNYELIIGTTSKPSRWHARMPSFSPKQIKDKIRSKKVSVLFGPEDKGLSNEELEMCDMIMHIPTSQEYPVMNLSHAVAVVLYELSDIGCDTIEQASREAKELFYKRCEDLLDLIPYPEHRKHKTLLILRRVIGRAGVTSEELRNLQGIISKIELVIR